MKWLFRSLFASMLVLSFSAFAVVVSDLNVASVAVKNTSEEARQAALPQAFAQVLVKVSGNPSIMTIPAIQNATDQIDSLIESYSYTNKETDEGSRQLCLQVNFDRKGLKALLRQAGQTDWPTNRPLSLVWIQLNDQGDSHWISGTSENDLLKPIRQIAQQRGLPILFPAMDLTDQAYTNTDNENFDQALLEQAMQRYGATAILAGQVTHSGQVWSGHWLLLFNESPHEWNNEGSDLPTLLQKTTSEMANLLANQLAQSDQLTLQTGVLVEVDHVESLNDYAKVLSVFRDVSGVTGVSIKDMNGSSLVLQVNIVGGAQALSQRLSGQPRLAAVDAMNMSEAQKTDLVYQWQGVVAHEPG